MCSNLTGCEGLPGCSSVQLFKISLGEGRFGPMGVNLMLSSTFFSVLSDALAVVK